jgi:hypothetical protein
MSSSYYDTSYPPSVWEPVVIPATGATAGIPGSWEPAGSTPPNNVANLMAGIPSVVTASPNTPWTTGQFVQTGTAGVAGRATWTGTAWVGGAAPLEAPQEAPQAPVVPQEATDSPGDPETAPSDPEAPQAP